MIKKFVDQFIQNKEKIESVFRGKHPDDYAEIVKIVVSFLESDSDYGCPDPERIHRIDDGDYQGILVFVIASKGYQPGDYWYVKVAYGSCSGCDTLQAIHDFGSDSPTEQQVEDYMMLALHIVQQLGKME